MTTASQHIYLDHNATSPLLAPAWAAMEHALRAAPGNPASQHWAGRRSRQLLEDAREGVGTLLGMTPGSTSRGDRLVFTSGGTEANNLALLGFAGGAPGHAVISTIEHPSIVGPAEELRRRGWCIDRLPVLPDGVIDVDALHALLRPETQLVSVMLANNETGVLQPVERVVAICQERAIPVHTDATQAVGKVPVDFRQLGAAAMTMSGHKFGGPVGSGALILRHDLTLHPLLHGGFQQAGLRPGTESVILAAGLQAALAWCCDQMAARTEHIAALRDEFEERLRAGWPELIVNGGAASRLPHVSNVAFRGLDRQALVMALDLAGVCCSTGSACASGSSEPSPVLLAMGCSEEVIQSAVRFSFGPSTTVAETAAAADRILNVCNKLREGKLGQKFPGSGRREEANLVN